MKRETKESFDIFYDWAYRLAKGRLIKKRKQMNTVEKQAEMSRIYQEKTGRPLDWSQLSTYTEKMQWAKLFDTSEIKVKLSDKVAVKEWVADKIGEEYVIPTLGVYNRAEDIPYDQLPDQFVIKTNNASGTNLIVKDKGKLNKRKTRLTIKRWLDTNFSYINGFEMHYEKIPAKILIEKYMETKAPQFYEYRFLCFDGKPYYCIFDDGVGTEHQRNIYDMNWELQPFNQGKFENIKEAVPKPDNYEEMITLATNLAEDIPHVRVDFYNIDGHIYFGEMTFTNASGFQLYKPEEYNQIIGDLWQLEK